MSIDVQQYSEEVYFNHVTDGDEYSARCKKSILVAGTSMGVARHDFFNHCRVDYVICDEAGQIPEPLALGPLFYGDVFVLVGDPEQLPPLIKSRRGREHGAGVSLMERLCKLWPDQLVQEKIKMATVLSFTNIVFNFGKLTEQYRFNSEINDLASNLVYDGKMKPHKLGKANKRLVDEVGEWKTKTSVDDWLRKVIDPETSVTWLDTSKVRNLETKMTSGYTNTTEFQECCKTREATFLSCNMNCLTAKVKLIDKIVDGLCENVTLNKKHIGIIAPYRAQINLLKEKLPNIMVDTVDKFQGYFHLLSKIRNFSV